MLDEIKRAYYESGKLKEETRYSGGKKNGPCRQYDENGILVAEQNYMSRANSFTNMANPRAYKRIIMTMAPCIESFP